jgi:SAM-dependent methyltransferase
MAGIIGGWLGYRVLCGLAPSPDDHGPCAGCAYSNRSKLDVLFGPWVWDELLGKRVIDFGCGDGEEAVEIARRGARSVIGVDIRPTVLARARQRASAAGVAERCQFTAEATEPADVVISLDAFEHFSHPEEVLTHMRRLVAPAGSIFIAFGPPWLHPLGGHLFSVFPWAHLVFTEKALLRWRRNFKTDGARRFSEVEGGLNQMTVRRFRTLVMRSSFEVRSFEAVPIRKLSFLANVLTREFLTSTVRCQLEPRS